MVSSLCCGVEVIRHPLLRESEESGLLFEIKYLSQAKAHKRREMLRSCFYIVACWQQQKIVPSIFPLI